MRGKAESGVCCAPMFEPETLRAPGADIGGQPIEPPAKGSLHAGPSPGWSEHEVSTKCKQLDSDNSAASTLHPIEGTSVHAGQVSGSVDPMKYVMCECWAGLPSLHEQV